MATLTNNISATDRLIRVTGGESARIHGLYRINDEIVSLAGFGTFPVLNGYRQPGLDPTLWRVNRGVSASVPDTHTAGATITAAVDANVSSESLSPPDPFADGGSGGVTVDNQDDPPAMVTTLIAQGATIDGDEATLPLLFSRIGPFTLEFDYAGVNSEPVMFGPELPIDSIVVRAMPFIITPFGDGALNPILQIVVGTVLSYDVVNWDADAQTSNGVPGQFLIDKGADVLSPVRYYPPRAALITGAGQKIGAVVWHDAGTLDAGEAAIYAIIAEPAS